MSDEKEVLSDLNKLERLYSEIPKEVLSEEAQASILRSARWGARKNYLFSLLTLKAIFKQPLVAGISSATGIAVGIVLSNSVMFGGLNLVGTTDEKMDHLMVPAQDKSKNVNLAKDLQFDRLVELGEQIPPLRGLSELSADAFRVFAVDTDIESIVLLSGEGDQVQPSELVFRLGDFSDQLSADNLDLKLKELGFNSNVAPSDLGSGSVMFRVQIGPFENMADIEQVQSALDQNSITYLPVKVSR